MAANAREAEAEEEWTPRTVLFIASSGQEKGALCVPRPQVNLPNKHCDRNHQLKV